MYKTIEIEELPVRCNRGERAMQLREFIRSEKKSVKLVDIKQGESWKVYCGLYNASKRKEFTGRVRVIKRGENVYLYRMG